MIHSNFNTVFNSILSENDNKHLAKMSGTHNLKGVTIENRLPLLFGI